MSSFIKMHAVYFPKCQPFSPVCFCSAISFCMISECHTLHMKNLLYSQFHILHTFQRITKAGTGSPSKCLFMSNFSLLWLSKQTYVSSKSLD